eukprot:5912325-Amphidinium_carterae.1
MLLTSADQFLTVGVALDVEPFFVAPAALFVLLLCRLERPPVVQFFSRRSRCQTGRIRNCDRELVVDVLAVVLDEQIVVLEVVVTELSSLCNARVYSSYF